MSNRDFPATCRKCGTVCKPAAEHWYSDDEDEEGNVTKWDILLEYTCPSCGHEWEEWE